MTKKTIAERLESIAKEMLELAADLKGTQHDVDWASKADILGHGESSDEQDYERAMEEMCKTKTASIAHFQRKFGWGYNHAAKILGLLKERGKGS